MEEQIQQLILEGSTGEALALLTQLKPDALLLQAQFNNGKKQYELGLIEFKEWQRIVSKLNYSALSMLERKSSALGGGQAGTGKGIQTPAAPSLKGTGDGSLPRTVFISYNTDDATVAHQVKDFLESRGLNVLIDADDLPPGKSIMEFIRECIRTAHAVLSIVSSKSLASGWVGQESVASMYAVWLADTKFIPVRLDRVAFDIDFQIAAQESIQEKLKVLGDKIKRLQKLGGDPRAFDDDRNRLTELKNNLGQIIQRMKSVNMPDISGANFEPNMAKVLEEIRKS